MTTENLATRQWMQKNELYDKDVENILTTNYEVNFPEQDFKKIGKEQWDELYRVATVERFKELKDQQSRNRLQQKMTKLEKHWKRISGYKSSVETNKTGTKNKPSRSQEDSDKLAKQGPALKKFMQKEQIWQIDLFEELVSAGVTNENELVKVDTEKKYDEIIRKVRVARKEDSKNQQAKNRLDKLLVKFEKIWRKKTGIKKKMQTNNTNKKTSKSKKETELDKKMNDGRDLKVFMRKNNIFEKDLFDELLKLNITCEGDIVKLDTQNKFDDVVKKVRVHRFTELKDQQSKNRLDKKLVDFEKIWRKKTGIKKTMGTGKNKNKKSKKKN